MDFTLIDNDVDQSSSLIYLWEIHNHQHKKVGCYVGKAKNGAKRPLRRYAKNVKRLLANQPYHIKNRDYRRVHYALAQAVKQQYRITLTLICNVKQDQSIDALERHYILHYQAFGSEDWQLNAC